MRVPRAWFSLLAGMAVAAWGCGDGGDAPPGDVTVQVPAVDKFPPITLTVTPTGEIEGDLSGQAVALGQQSMAACIGFAFRDFPAKVELTLKVLGGAMSVPPELTLHDTVDACLAKAFARGKLRGVGDGKISVRYVPAK